MKRFREKQKVYKLIYFFSNINEFCRKSDCSNKITFLISVSESKYAPSYRQS